MNKWKEDLYESMNIPGFDEAMLETMNSMADTNHEDRFDFNNDEMYLIIAILSKMLIETRSLNALYKQLLEVAKEILEDGQR